MTSTDKCGKAAIVLSALASQLGLFITRSRTRRTRTLPMRALFMALALIPAASALAAAECNTHHRTHHQFIIDARGLVMTNSHVVFGAQAVTVTQSSQSFSTQQDQGKDKDKMR